MNPEPQMRLLKQSRFKKDSKAIAFESFSVSPLPNAFSQFFIRPFRVNPRGVQLRMSQMPSDHLEVIRLPVQPSARLMPERVRLYGCHNRSPAQPLAIAALLDEFEW